MIVTISTIRTIRTISTMPKTEESENILYSKIFKSPQNMNSLTTIGIFINFIDGARY